MLRLRSMLVLAAVMLVALVGSGCRAQADAASQKPTGPLTIAVDPWPGNGVMYIAEARGFYQQEGVDVELTLYDSAARPQQLFAEKRVDGAASVLADAIAQTAAGIPAQVVWLTDMSIGGDVLVAKNAERLTDLRGKRIGVTYGAFGHVFTMALFKQAGVESSEITIVNLDPSEVPAALAAGSIDAGHTYDPFTEEAIQNGAVVIGSSAEVPGIIIDIIAFQKGSIEADPERMQRFVRAISAAQAWWAENPAEGNIIVAEAFGLTVEEVTDSMTALRLYSGADNQAAMDPASQDSSSAFVSGQAALDAFMQAGLIEAPVDLESVINSSFVQSLLSR